MADTLELHEGESVENEIKGDYWERTLCFYSQKRGNYWFTNERILFRGGFTVEIDIPYSDIESVKLCNVGPVVQFLPTGIKVTTKDGKSHKLSVLKRKSILELIQGKMN